MSAETMHKHRCLRCGEEFTCRTPRLCAARYDVMPSIVTLAADGQPQVEDHCFQADGKWIPLWPEGQVDDEPIGKHGPYGTHTNLDGSPVFATPSSTREGSRMSASQKLDVELYQPTVTVEVTPELLKQLGEWSEPVQIRVERVGGEWTMAARRPDVDPAALARHADALGEVAQKLERQVFKWRDYARHLQWCGECAARSPMGDMCSLGKRLRVEAGEASA